MLGGFIKKRHMNFDGWVGSSWWPQLPMAVMRFFGASNAPSGVFFMALPIANCATIGSEMYNQEGAHGGWFYTSGWNGGWHEAQYNPCLIAWARGSHKLRRTRRFMKQARSWYNKQPKNSPVAEALAARYAVRLGD